MNDKSKNSIEQSSYERQPKIDQGADQSSGDGLMKRDRIVRDSGPEDEPLVTALEQARRRVDERHRGKASVLHLGAASLGLNFNFTDEGRQRFIEELEPAIRIVEKIYNEADFRRSGQGDSNEAAELGSAEMPDEHSR